jgi:hypothetical protein
LEDRGSVESEGFKQPAGTSDMVLTLAVVLWVGLAAALNVVRVSKDNSCLWSGIAVGGVPLFAIGKVMAAPRAPQSLFRRPSSTKPISNKWQEILALVFAG